MSSAEDGVGDSAPSPNDPAGGSPPAPEDSASPPPEAAPGTDPAADAAAGPGAAAADGMDPLDVEALVISLEQVAAERDEWQATAQRIQAEFANYKKRSAKDAELAIDQRTGKLAEAMLPVLDACDGAVSHGSEDVVPIKSSILDALAGHGLERIDPDGSAAFDPELHEAVMHDPAGDDGPGHAVVVEVMRAGYRWQGRVLRPAMVRVQG